MKNYPPGAILGGCWYYEVTLLTDGLMQIGWADGLYEGDPDRGQGEWGGGEGWIGWMRWGWMGLTHVLLFLLFCFFFVFLFLFFVFSLCLFSFCLFSFCLFSLSLSFFLSLLLSLLLFLLQEWVIIRILGHWTVTVANDGTEAVRIME